MSNQTDKLTASKLYISLLERISQISSIPNAIDVTYELAPSTVKIEEIIRQNRNYSAEDVLPVLEHIWQRLRDAFLRVYQLDKDLEELEQDVEYIGNNVRKRRRILNIAIDELNAFSLAIYYEKQFLDDSEVVNSDPEFSGTNKRMIQLFNPEPRNPLASVVLDKNQSALLFNYLKEFHLIYDHWDLVLGKIIAVLTGHSKDTLRAALSPVEIGRIKADELKEKGHADEEYYNLNQVQKWLQRIIDKIEAEKQKPMPVKKRK